MLGRKKDCETCVMYEYHTYQFPEKITTKEQRYKDEILTVACRTCNDYGNYQKGDPHQNLNERFVRALELELRKKLGNNGYEDETKKMEKEKELWAQRKENFQNR